MARAIPAKNYHHRDGDSEDFSRATENRPSFVRSLRLSFHVVDADCDEYTRWCTNDGRKSAGSDTRTKFYRRRRTCRTQCRRPLDALPSAHARGRNDRKENASAVGKRRSPISTVQADGSERVSNRVWPSIFVVVTQRARQFERNTGATIRVLIRAWITVSGVRFIPIVGFNSSSVQAAG